jgi:hypothetical protein
MDEEKKAQNSLGFEKMVAYFQNNQMDRSS